jgi:hypothetical protein
MSIFPTAALFACHSVSSQIETHDELLDAISAILLITSVHFAEQRREPT